MNWSIVIVLLMAPIVMGYYSFIDSLYAPDPDAECVVFINNNSDANLNGYLHAIVDTTSLYCAKITQDRKHYKVFMLDELKPTDLIKIDFNHEGNSPHNILRLSQDSDGLQIKMKRRETGETVKINNFSEIGVIQNNGFFYVKLEKISEIHHQRKIYGIKHNLYCYMSDLKATNEAFEITYIRKLGMLKYYEYATKYTLEVYIEERSYVETGGNRFGFIEDDATGDRKACYWTGAGLNANVTFHSDDLTEFFMGKYHMLIQMYNTTFESPVGTLRWPFPNENIDYFDMVFTYNGETITVVPERSAEFKRGQQLLDIQYKKEATIVNNDYGKLKTNFVKRKLVMLLSYSGKPVKRKPEPTEAEYYDEA